MKNKLKYVRSGLLYSGILFLLWNCQSENVDPLKQQNTVETVSVDEAINFFTVKTASNSAKSAGEIYAIPHLNHLSQEEIINSDALLTVIPATTVYGAHYSRILLLKIDNEIRSLVFGMYASGEATHEYFTGEILITDLQGNFLNGYRVANGQFVSQFRKKTGIGNIAAKSGNVVCPEHGECNGESGCILCLQELEEVEVTGEAGGSGDGIEVYPGLNDFPGMEGGDGGPDMSMGWDYGPGEGSSPNNNNDTNTEEDLVEENPPSCESFNYSQVGTTDWQCAAVIGVHELFTIFNWECIGYDWGIFHQPLYFQLPVNSTFPLASGLTATNSAAFLHEAFKAFDVWYKNNGCTATHTAMEQQLLEYIKDEFEEQGGNVTLTPPMGFTGEPTPYKISWFGYGNCN